MKRINPKTNQPFAYGDVREDGFVFVDFRKTRPLKKDGHYQENWLNPDKFEKRREFSAKSKKDWRSERPEYVRAYSKKHQMENPEHYAAKTAKRRSAKLQRTPPWLTEDQLCEMADLYLIAKMFQMYTGETYHVDHIVPLQGDNVSGLHVPWNLQILHYKENLQKSNKTA